MPKFVSSQEKINYSVTLESIMLISITKNKKLIVSCTQERFDKSKLLIMSFIKLNLSPKIRPKVNSKHRPRLDYINPISYD